MSRTGQTRRGGAAARLLGLLALVLGLFAMHGLASAHHAAAAPPGHASPVDAAPAAVDHFLPPQDRDGTHRHDHGALGSRAAAVRTTAAGSPDVAGAGPAGPVCGDDCLSGLAVLCAGVIAAATAGLVAPMARRRVPAPPTRGGPWPRAPAAARRLLPGPDPVAELCVSRT